MEPSTVLTTALLQKLMRMASIAERAPISYRSTELTAGQQPAGRRVGVQAEGHGMCSGPTYEEPGVEEELGGRAHSAARRQPAGRAGNGDTERLPAARLIAGPSGTGKTNLIYAWMGALAARYSPAELAFYLLDFK